jgi:hypothetical protein
MTCPNCGDPTAWTKCWAYGCGWEEEASTTDVPPSRRDAVKDTRSEDEIQKATKHALGLLGYTVCDFSQGRQTRQTPGIPDLYVQGHGVCAWLEMKSAKGKPSPAQVEFVARELANGGSAAIVYSDFEAVHYVESLREK